MQVLAGTGIIGLLCPLANAGRGWPKAMAPGLYREKGMVFRMFLSALAATGSGEGSGGMLVMLVQMVPLILVFVVMYFIMIRPQKKKEKEYDIRISMK